MIKSVLATTALATLIAVGSSMSAMSAENPKVRVCSGKSDGGYHIASLIVARNARIQGLDVEVVTDTGGSWANVIRGVATPKDNPASCDVFVAQSSAILRLARQSKSKLLDLQYAGYAVTEVPQLVCARSEKVKNLADVVKSSKKSIAVGGQDSGSAITLEDYRSVDDSLKPISTIGNPAVASLQDGSATCSLIVGVIGDPDVQQINDNYSDKFLLADITNSAYTSVVNPINRFQVYRTASIPNSAYPKLLSHNWSRMDTFVTDSGFYVVKSKLDPGVIAKFANAVSNSQREIEANLVPDYLRKQQ